jgi:xylan 1,4-beta-xylosidase
MNIKLFSYSRLLVSLIPLTFIAAACGGTGVDDLVPGGGGTGAAVGVGGTGSGGTGTGGTGSGAAPGTGGDGSGGVIPPGTGGIIVVPTVECEGPFPTEDVSAAQHKVTAGGTRGALTHFWTTYGLGRLGLYLDDSLLADAHKPQNKTNFDGEKWSDVFRAQTVEAVETLELRRVRAHGLFHDDIGIYTEDGSGTPVYNWERSDDIFDFLVENDIHPIIELASMPAALAADPSQTVFDWNMIVSPPKDYDKWQGLVQAFVQHSVDTYCDGVVDENCVVQDWLFEVWNEPECCSQKFWKGSMEDYFQLYDKAAAGVRAVLPEGRVGGPVSSQSAEVFDGQWPGGTGPNFLDHIKTSGSPLGFFTFHTWNFVNGAVQGFFDVRALLDSDTYNLDSLPIAVTEFGPTWEFGLREVGMDGVWEPQERDQGATFAAQTYADIANRAATANPPLPMPIAYAWWTLSDVFDEGYEDDGDYVLEQNPFIGAMGLYGREGIKKPAYNTYKFLGQMGDEHQAVTVEGLGDLGGLAARDTTDGGLQLLIYNGQDPGPGFSMDSYYTVTADQSVGVTITGMNAESAYDVTAYRVDPTHGNAWALWDAQGRPTMANMTADQWAELRAGMESPAEPIGTALCGASFSKNFMLASPGVLFVTIEPALPPPTP